MILLWSFVAHCFILLIEFIFWILWLQTILYEIFVVKLSVESFVPKKLIWSAGWGRFCWRYFKRRIYRISVFTLVLGYFWQGAILHNRVLSVLFSVNILILLIMILLHIDHVDNALSILLIFLFPIVLFKSTVTAKSSVMLLLLMLVVVQNLIIFLYITV